MSCVLRFGGDDADVTQLVQLSPVTPIDVFVKGQPRTRWPGSHSHVTSGITLSVSDADFTRFDEQKSNARTFLERYEPNLRAMREATGVEFAIIDFAVTKRDVFAQSECFDSDLLRLIVGLCLDLELTQYPPTRSMKSLKQRRRRRPGRG